MQTLSRLVLVLSLLGGLSSPAFGAAQDERAWVGALREIVEREAAQKGIPSLAVVVVDRRGALAEVVHGRLGSDGAEPAAPETLYRTGSVGKTLTDLAVLVAVEQGRLDLDRDVRTYVPEFRPSNPFGEPITLRHLMTHTAGLVREPPVGSYFDATSPSLQATVRSLEGTSLLWQPGSRTKYSNAGLAVVGRALERVYERSYADVMRALVFAPAGMETAVVGRASVGSRPAASGLMQRPDGTTWPAPTFDLGMAPAGDMYASLRDMRAFMVALLAGDGRLAEPETVRSMWTPFPARDEWHLEVGLGFSLDGRFAGRYRMARNGGAVYGFATELALLPEQGLGVYAVAARDLANETVQAIAHWALRAALADRHGEQVPELEPFPMPFREASARITRCSRAPDGLPHARLLGIYGEEHSPIVICREDGKLHAVLEWMFIYPLAERADGRFALPSYALYGHETLRFVGSGEHPDAVLLGVGTDGVRFQRR